MRQQFGSLTATELYCPRCQRAQPVREKLLLILPGGEVHDYLCTRCGESLGKRTVSGPTLSQATPRPAVLPRRPSDPPLLPG